MNFLQRLFSKKKEERRPQKRPYNSSNPSSLGSVMYPDDSSNNPWVNDDSPYTSSGPHTNFGGGSFGGGGASDSWDSSGSDSSSSDSGSPDCGSSD